MRAALNEVATVAPEWLQATAPAAWYERYGRPVENYRLPKTETARQDLAATISADGQQLLNAVDMAAEQTELAQLPAVQVLRQVWTAQYVTEDGHMRLGSAAELPPSAEQICSPYDPEARYSNKRDVTWTGYKVQVTETCDPACEGPHAITNVETTPATTPDDTWSRWSTPAWNGVACCRANTWWTRANPQDFAGLHGLARAGGQPAALWGDHHRPGRERPELAGAPG